MGGGSAACARSGNMPASAPTDSGKVLMGRSVIQSSTTGNPTFGTQAERIETLLRSRYGAWVPAYELSDLALQYCARIASIRKKLKTAGGRERVENKTEWVSGQCHGSYRIVKTVDLLGLSTPNTPRPKSWEEIVKEREEKSAPSFELVP
jgi:hypothetical protein